MTETHEQSGGGQRPLKVVALTRKIESASFERRVTDYAAGLADRGIELSWRFIPKDRAGRRELARSLSEFDVVWWHKYLIPPFRLGEFRRSARRIVFDFDDPIIYSTHGKAGRANFSRMFKFSRLLKRCDAATAGSEYLADIARRYCRKVFIQPMSIELPKAVPQRPSADGQATLLWLGSQSTMKYLRPLATVLERVGKQRPGVTMRLVGHEPLESRNMRIDFRQWSPAEQDHALAECDIGLCPMPDTPWTRGKCPYKVLQYMAWEMSWVGSAVGENLTTAGEAGADDQRGLCAADDDEWVAALLRLIDDAAGRCRLGKSGRRYVQEYRSVAKLADRLADIFRSVAGDS